VIMGKVYVKVHEIPDQGKVLAVSDEALIGRTLNDKKRDIIFEISEEFYRGELIDVEELVEFLKREGNINIIGNTAVGAAIEAGLIKDEDTMLIDGVRHAQIYRI